MTPEHKKALSGLRRAVRCLRRAGEAAEQAAVLLSQVAPVNLNIDPKLMPYEAQLLQESAAKWVGGDGPEGGLNEYVNRLLVDRHHRATEASFARVLRGRRKKA